MIVRNKGTHLAERVDDVEGVESERVGRSGRIGVRWKGLKKGSQAQFKRKELDLPLLRYGPIILYSANFPPHSSVLSCYKAVLRLSEGCR